MKELIKGEPKRQENIDKVDFEILGNIEGMSMADRFNLYYVQSIGDIVKTVNNEINKINKVDRRAVHGIENRDIMENFVPVNVVDLEQIVMKLPRKKGTEEGITSDILKRLLQVVKVKVEFTEIINDSLGDGIFPERWKTSRPCIQGVPQ